MQCSECRFWLTARVTDYEDGSRVFNFQSAEGKGLCQDLKIETPLNFGCNRFEAGNDHIEVVAKKTGSPWHHMRFDVCPDCNGIGVVGPLGDAGCGRCCRTGKVPYYDDGYIGEQKYRRHPNEETKGPPPVPTCGGCLREIDRNWIACPWCGQKQGTEAINEPEFL